jgi:hypothetical protein
MRMQRRADMKSDFKKLLTPAEHAMFRKLSTPQKIQDYLESLPTNFELKGETYRSPRRVFRDRTAHCFEGALVAAAAIAYHGGPPLIMDFRSLPDQDDHVVTPFRLNGLWGAISKTNHSVLRYRDPVYRDVRELAMSYFHEFYEKDRRKSLLEYSAPFDLSRYSLERWLVAEEDLYWLTKALDKTRHYQTVPKRSRRHLRLVAPVELRAMTVIEWSKYGKRYA